LASTRAPLGRLIRSDEDEELLVAFRHLRVVGKDRRRPGAARSGVGDRRRDHDHFVDLEFDVESNRAQDLAIGRLDLVAPHCRAPMLGHEYGVLGVERDDGIGVRSIQCRLVASEETGRRLYLRTRVECVHRGLLAETSIDLLEERALPFVAELRGVSLLERRSFHGDGG